MHHARKAVFKELSDFSGWVLNNFDVKDCTQDSVDQTCTVQNVLKNLQKILIEFIN